MKVAKKDFHENFENLFNRCLTKVMIWFGASDLSWRYNLQRGNDSQYNAKGD